MPKNKNYSVTATTNHGEIIKKNDELFFAVPRARAIEVFFSIADAKGMEVDFRKLEFKVTGVPIPDLIIKQNEVEIDFKKGISVDQISAFEINIVPDKSFAKYHPEETRYRVSTCKVYLFRGNEVQLEITNDLSNVINLSSFSGKVQQGDRIYIEIEDLQRKNFMGQVEIIRLDSGNKFNIPII